MNPKLLCKFPNNKEIIHYNLKSTMKSMFLKWRNLLKPSPLTTPWWQTSDLKIFMVAIVSKYNNNLRETFTIKITCSIFYFLFIYLFIYFLQSFQFEIPLIPQLLYFPLFLNFQINLCLPFWEWLLLSEHFFINLLL